MPKNAKGAGSIRKRKDGLWEARYTTGRDPGTGKQIRKSIYGKSQQEVRKKLSAVTSAIDEGTYIEPSRLTFGQWLDIWLKEYCGSVKPRTKELYGSYIETRIRAALGAVKLFKLSAVIIQNFYNEASEGAPDGKNKLSPKTIKNLHGVIHKALQQAVQIGYLKNNPADACKLPKVEKAQIKPMNREQTKAFISALEGDYLRRVYLVTLFTGMRLGEVIGLPWGNVDFKRGTIEISQQLQRIDKIYMPVPPKNGKPRTITPASFVMELLREERASQRKQRKEAGELWSNPYNLVFTNAAGTHLSHRLLYAHMRKPAEKIGMPELRFHDLRHTYAVSAIQAGDDIKTVSENLGHASVAFTLDIYGHVTEEMKRSSADRMQNYIESL